MSAPRLDAALEFAARGWRVLPLDGKAPAGRLVRHGVNDATTDLSLIRGWFGYRPDLGVGVATGDGLVVLDVDPRNGGDRSLDAYLYNHRSRLPRTAEVLTGGGGRHLYFRGPAGVRGRTIAPGLDVKAAGGYVVAPPSIHPSGREYVWHPDRALGSTGVAILPGWIGAALSAPAPTVSSRPSSADSDDPLGSIAPPAYVRDLGGLVVGAEGGKVVCPFHRDRTPSLHVYPDAERGWYCYGCQRGGGIYQFAALVGGFELPLRGAAFLRVQEALSNYYAKRWGADAA